MRQRPCPADPNATPRAAGPWWTSLNFLGILPGIYFIFSRNGCDQAVEQCINAGLELTTDEEVHQAFAASWMRWWRGNSLRKT